MHVDSESLLSLEVRDITPGKALKILRDPRSETVSIYVRQDLLT